MSNGEPFYLFKTFVLGIWKKKKWKFDAFYRVKWHETKNFNWIDNKILGLWHESPNRNIDDVFLEFVSRFVLFASNFDEKKSLNFVELTIDSIGNRKLLTKLRNSNRNNNWLLHSYESVFGCLIYSIFAGVSTKLCSVEAEIHFCCLYHDKCFRWKVNCSIIATWHIELCEKADGVYRNQANNTLETANVQNKWINSIKRKKI